jgi:hypothetical protein
MSTYAPRKRTSLGSFLLDLPSQAYHRLQLPSLSMFGLIIIGALLAFEVFNYSTTEFAFLDLLGDLSFAGIRWATILALAFCGMDFAGIARLFTPEQDRKGHIGTWYLLGAWLLAATMNALLTWWSVSIALLQHQGLGNEILGRDALLSGVPLFVAMLVWLIRVLMIGTFTLTGARLFATSPAATRVDERRKSAPPGSPQASSPGHPTRQTIRPVESSLASGNGKRPRSYAARSKQPR